MEEWYEDTMEELKNKIATKDEIIVGLLEGLQSTNDRMQRIKLNYDSLTVMYDDLKKENKTLIMGKKGAESRYNKYTRNWISSN